MKQKTKTLLTSIISVMLAVIMVAGVAPLSGFVLTASAAWGSTPNGIVWEIDNETGVMTIYTNEAYSVSWKTYRNDVTEIRFSDDVTDIPVDAFSDFPNLLKVVIGNNIEVIGDGAFAACEKLQEVIIGEKVSTISAAAFYETSIEKVIIPDNVITIGDRAFFGFKLTDVMIGSGLKNLGINAFHGFIYENEGLSPTLTNINVSEENKYFSSENGVLFDKSKNKLIQYPEGNDRTNYIIPNGVTKIESGAFSGCKSLTNITIPGSVTSIGDGAFCSCDSLTSVTIPDSVTSISYVAFSDCNSLTSVTIGNNVTNIGDSAFAYCESLTSVTIGNSVTNIGADAFYNCKSLADVYYTGSEEDWNKITIDDGNDPLLNATIHYNWTGESPNISMPQTVKDESSGIEVSAPSGAYEGTLELEIEEVFNGESYNVVSTIDGAAQNKVYDITTKVDGEPAQPGKAVTVRIPLPEGYDPDRTYVYHVNSETGEVENMNARYEDGCLVFETDHFSVYAVVEMEEERSFFGKVIDVLLGIVSLPVKLIVGLFKLIIGLFIK